jgi:hypothetical protein
MGFGLLTRQRMAIRPNRIKGLSQLKSILKRAKQIEADINGKALLGRHPIEVLTPVGGAA